MLEFFFIERGLLRTITRSLWAPDYQCDKKQKTNKPAYQRPTPVFFLLQLLLLVEFSFSRTPDRRLIGD